MLVDVPRLVTAYYTGADGIVITHSHNPPDNGGFEYNPPNGGPADGDVTGWIEARANAYLESGLEGVRRMPYEKALRAGSIHRHYTARLIAHHDGVAVLLEDAHILWQR